MKQIEVRLGRGARVLLAMTVLFGGCKALSAEMTIPAGGSKDTAELCTDTKGYVQVNAEGANPNVHASFVPRGGQPGTFYRFASADDSLRFPVSYAAGTCGRVRIRNVGSVSFLSKILVAWNLDTGPTTPPEKAPDGPVTPPPANCGLTAGAESCWAKNTGVRGWTEAQIVAGQSPLKRVDGDVIMDTGGMYHWDSSTWGKGALIQAGSSFDSYYINGCIAVWASNVKISNFLVRSGHYCGGKSGGWARIGTGVNGDSVGLVVTDTEIDGLTPYNQNHQSGAMGIGQTGYTCLRCNIHGVSLGAKGDQDVTVKDSYLHDLGGHCDGDPTTSDHFDVFAFAGGAGNVNAIHNWMKAPQGCATGAGVMNFDGWSGKNIVYDSNYFDGGAGADVTGPSGHYPGVVVKNNALQPGGAHFRYGFVASDTWLNNYDAVTLTQIAFQ